MAIFSDAALALQIGMTLTEAIRSALLGSGVSIRRLSADTEIDRKTLRLFLEGVSYPSAKNLDRLAEYLDLELRPKRRAAKKQAEP